MKNTKFLKLLFTGLIAFLLINEGMAQVLLPTHVSYTYDAAGNRIQRKILMGARKGEFKNYHDSLANHSINIMPNPTTGAMDVKIAGYGDTAQVNIILFDMTGKLLLNIPKATETTHLDLSNYAAGIYNMRISINSNETVWRVVKE